MTTPLIASLVALPAIVFLCFRHGTNNHGSLPSSDIPRVPPIWYIGSASFFIDPSQFVKDSMRWAKDSIFSFRVLRNTVIVLRGSSGRDAFFSRGLDFMGGYRLLNPELDSILKIDAFGDFRTLMAKSIASDTLERLSPLLIEDAWQALEKWGDHGAKDPFTSMHEIVFILSTRMTICREFSEDPKKIQALISIFKRIEAGFTHTSILFPWFPTPVRVKKLVAGIQLYRMISAVVASRRKNDRREDDPLQALMDKGLSITETTMLLAMMLFAAIGNTGIVLTWTLLQLEANPEWKELVQNEARQLYEDSQAFVDTAKPLLTIASIEKETPVIDRCISETLRILFKGPFIRQNIEGDIFVDQKRIPQGAYVLFPTGDVHDDARFYSTPEKFNPEHFSTDAIDERRQHGITFVGWGAGRHVCPGKRAAHATMKIVLVLLLSKFNIRALDERGKPLRTVPEHPEKKLFKVSPAKEALTLCYETRHSD